MIDQGLLEGAHRAIERWGWREATLERIATEAGVSRMTLHRRGVTRDGLLAALAERLETAYRSAMWPALTARGSATFRPVKKNGSSATQITLRAMVRSLAPMTRAMLISR